MAARAAMTFCWRGTTNTVPTTSTNWVKTDGSAVDASDYPGWDNSEASNVNGDTIMLDAAVTNGIATASGWDGTAKGDIAAFIVSALYDKAIGLNAANPLQLDCQAAGSVRINGVACGNIYLKGAGAQGLVNVALSALKSGSTAAFDGTIAGFTQYGGAASIAATATITGTMMTTGTGATLAIGSGATLPAAISAFGGITTCLAAVTAVTVNAPAYWSQGNTATTVNVNGTGAAFVWTAGTITTANVNGGTFDGSTSATARTLTNATVWSGATLNLDNKAGNIVVTNPISMQGGSLSTIYVSSGKTLAVA